MEIRIYEEGPFVLNLVYNRSLKEKIFVGNYDFCNYDINEKNLTAQELSDQEQKLLVRLFSFNQRISSREAILQMKHKRRRPAILDDLIFFELEYPELCKEVPIIALGSIVRDIFGVNSVPQFLLDKSGRNLYLDLFERRWEEGDKFLAIDI